MSRQPHEILADIVDMDKSSVIHDLLWEVIEDVRSSYRLALTGIGLDEGRIDEVQDTVRDYLTNHYGDT